jgi:hypothetical protein
MPGPDAFGGSDFEGRESERVRSCLAHAHHILRERGGCEDCGSGEKEAGLSRFPDAGQNWFDRLHRFPLCAAPANLCPRSAYSNNTNLLAHSAIWIQQRENIALIK